MVPPRLEVRMRAIGLGLSATLLASSMLLGCSDPPVDEVPLAPCNPLGGAGCMAPWPSSVYLRDDPSSPTGVRLDMPIGAFPSNRDGEHLDTAPLNRHTGFSPATQIVTAFAGGVDPSNLAFWDHYERSVTDDSPTVIVDMSTGQRVAHFAEVDANERARDKSEQALYLRPAARLTGGTRYAVGIRRSLRSADGSALPMPAGFELIRHRVTTSLPLLEKVRTRTEEAVAALDAAGVPPGDLVVAWDFVTADDDSVRADTLAARDRALEAMGELGANLGFRIERDSAGGVQPDPRVAREIELSFDVPNLLAADGSGLARDADHRPVVDGVTSAPALALVPVCTTPRPEGERMPILLFGHGFFGSYDEAQSNHVRRVAADLCMVVLAGQWRGMSGNDLDVAIQSLTEPNTGIGFGERMVQGIIDFIALEQLSRGKLASELFTVDGVSIVDPTRAYFLGVSQGHILGSTFFAYDPFLTRGVMHVGGAEWSLLFERSLHWSTFAILLEGTYQSLFEVVLVQQFMQMVFDPTDPVHVSPGALTTPLPGTPAKQWLLQESDSDPAVSNLATELQARTMGLPVVAPALRVPYGLTETAAPLTSGLAIFTEQPSPRRDPTNVLSDSAGNVAHDRLRRRKAVVDQMKHFFATGEIIAACGDVPCDCAAGACGPLD
jgi:hypothetical protein